MEFIRYGAVFLPVLLMLVSLVLRQGKVRLFFIIGSGFLFFVTALFLFMFPPGSTGLYIPPVLWKLITLLSVIFVCIRAIREKHYPVMILTAIQSIALILLEISVFPDEPSVFFEMGQAERFLFLAGAFLTAMQIPLILPHLEKYIQQIKASEKQRRYAQTGIYLLMASFAGLLSAVSFNGLLLFWQWKYLANDLILKGCKGKNEKKAGFIPVLQQSALTVWTLAAAILSAGGNTSLASGSFTGQAGTILAVLLFLTAFIQAGIIPEKSCLREAFTKPVSILGLDVTLSLIVPFALFYKCSALFSAWSHDFISMIVFIGSLYLFFGAYHAGLAKSGKEMFCHTGLFISGLGIICFFSSLQGNLTDFPLATLIGSIGISLLAAAVFQWIFVFTADVIPVLTAKLRKSNDGFIQPVHFCPYSLFAWLPSVPALDLWVSAALLIASVMLVGRAASCFG